MVFGFGGGSSNASSAAAAPAGMPNQFDQAMTEIDMMSDIFNRLVSSCHAKCISTRYHEADLNKGESVCIDRCVAKFFAVNAKVGEKMTSWAGGAGAGGAPSGGGLF